MQNTVYECKQNGEVFFSSLCVTSFRFGNYPDNGLVTTILSDYNPLFIKNLRDAILKIGNGFVTCQLLYSSSL